MRFRGKEVVFHRLKIESKTVNVAKYYVEKVKRGIKTPGVAWGHLWSPRKIGTPKQRVFLPY